MRRTNRTHPTVGRSTPSYLELGLHSCSSQVAYFCPVDEEDVEGKGGVSVRQILETTPRTERAEVVAGIVTGKGQCSGTRLQSNRVL